jgi:hypothetical protein
VRAGIAAFRRRSRSKETTERSKKNPSDTSTCHHACSWGLEMPWAGRVTLTQSHALRSTNHTAIPTA